MPASASILFTAFEPSGDAHAAPVIRELRRLAPSFRVCAWGGPRMLEAGATLIERSADDGAMGLNAAQRALTVRSHIRAIDRWSKEHRVIVHVPVDSPAANFPVCRIMRRRGARIVHLVAPQLWAWGRWRLRKLRRLTDLVLCLLPFEEQWFTDRRVPARFIGHPVMNREIDMAAVREAMHGLPQGSPRILILPGSRSSEVRANIRLLAAVYTELRDRHAGASGVIIAANANLGQIVRRKIGVFPTGLHLSTGLLDPAIAWCDMALAVSGTVSLNVARFHKPMIGVYQASPVSWLGARLLLRTRYRLLPNIIAGREICPEFIPHMGGAMSIVRKATRLIDDSRNAAVQSEGLRRVTLRFANKRPAEEAARLIVRVAGLESGPQAA